MKYFLWFIFTTSLFACKASQSPNPSGENSTVPARRMNSDLQEIKGFIPIYWDNQQGKLLLKVSRLNEEFLYINALKTGIGSNDIGLDRGQFDAPRIVKFIKNGPKIVLVQPNYDFRAETGNEAEKKAVREAFAISVLWAFPILEYSTDGYLVDATDFLLQDVHHVADAIGSAKQGNYSLDQVKSFIDAEGLKNFPDNTEIECMLTFSGKPAGEYIQRVSPEPRLVSVILRHSFIRLPDEQYEKREFDPRAGYFGITYYDYATPVTQPLAKRYICRHRLKKKSPVSEKSPPVEPIIYYLDPGIPEPVQSALLEGASWWNEAFEAAGYIDAFQVKVLPADADPLDVRYNVIQWVHRSTRGWSYGTSLVDPRTGEIIKGHVTLGSLRVRQDILIARGLLSPFGNNSEDTTKITGMALARIRQLAAHEVGHTLGLVHNYASSVNDRASVMDYPHPLINLSNEGEIDLSKAYSSGIGDWDKIAIRYGYTDFPEQQDESSALKSIIGEAIDQGLYFITDRNARPAGSAHPYAHLWDNNKNAADELNRMIEIRKRALQNFGTGSIPEGTPYSSLEDVLVPVYLLHRYQLEAASKLVGGLYFTYAVKGDSQVVTELIPPDLQLMALDALLRTVTPEFLKIPENILQLIPPRAMGYANTRENFSRRTGQTFDPFAAMQSAADLTFSMLLQPERMARIMEHHARQDDQPSLQDILHRIIVSTWDQVYDQTYEQEIRRMTSLLCLTKLMDLAAEPDTNTQVRAIVFAEIISLDQWIKENMNTPDPADYAHDLYARELIRKFRDNEITFKDMDITELPDGPPIGTDLSGCDLFEN